MPRVVTIDLTDSQSDEEPVVLPGSLQALIAENEAIKRQNAVRPGPWALDLGPWTPGPWILDPGRWTLGDMGPGPS